MDAADRDRAFVADLAAWRSGLGEATVMRFGGRATADDAGLRVLFVAQTDGLRRNATEPNDCRCRSGRLGTIEGLAFLRVFGAWVADNLRYLRGRLSSLDRDEPLPEAGFNSFRIGGRQCVFAREVLVNPLAASSADLRSLSSATSRSCNAFDWSVARTILEGLITLPFRLEPDGAKRQLINHRLRRRLNVETGFRFGVAARAKVRRIEIVLSCDSNQSEQRVPPRTSERRST
jgi:hypothetical protein